MRVQFISHEGIGVEAGGDHGGVGVSQRMVAEGMARRGHAVELVVDADGEWTREIHGVLVRGWKPHRGRLGPWRNLWRQKETARRFAAGGPAATIIPDVCAVTWPYPLATRKVIKFTCTHLLQKHEAAHDRPRWKTALAERLMVPRADAFMAISRRTAEVSARLFRVPLRSIAVIPNAVDTEMFSPDPTASRESGLLLYVGTVCEKKGAMEAVAALDLLVKENADLRLLMIGRNGVDLDGNPDFRGRIQSRFPETCRGHVRFLDHVLNDQLPAFYRRAAVAALPSYYESFGRTTIEAMACGTPVVRTEAPPAGEIIEHGVSGLLCRTRDHEDLARALARLIREPDLARAIGIAARDRVERTYSLERVAEQTEQFLREAVGL